MFAGGALEELSAGTVPAKWPVIRLKRTCIESCWSTMEDDHGGDLNGGRSQQRNVSGSPCKIFNTTYSTITHSMTALAVHLPVDCLLWLT